MLPAFLTLAAGAAGAALAALPVVPAPFLTGPALCVTLLVLTVALPLAVARIGTTAGRDVSPPR